MNSINNSISLRPKILKDYIGQDELKKNLKIFIGAAKKRHEVIDHILFYGPPGLGKTTLAYIIANEMHAKIHVVNGPSIEKTGDLACILSTIEAGDIIFIDEIHRLPKIIEEMLYSAMEDFKLITISGINNNVTNIDVQLPPFTLIGATTRIGSLTLPFKTRFGIVEKINFYSIENIKEIIKRNSKIFNIEIDDEAAYLIAARSRNTPRIANRLFKRIRDFANFDNIKKITKEIALKAFQALKINEIGLNNVDIKYLKTVIERFNGGPVGLEVISSIIGEEAINLENDYEPYLIQQGLINRTSKGRIATEKAKKIYLSQENNKEM